jgi:hypothetical protein
MDNFRPTRLPVWLLTLPAFADPDCDQGVWGSPYTWPGGWNHFHHRNAIAIRANDAPEARALAAEHDGCAIWLDQAYARCQVVDSDTPGVILSSGSGADNE